MSKKDYILIASILRNAKQNKQSIEQIVSNFCEQLKIDNGRFNAETFRKAVSTEK